MIHTQQTINTRRPNRKKIILLGLAVVIGVLVIMGAFKFVQRLNAPQPNLGSSFEYLGSQLSHCYFGGLVCDSDPFSDYYFATNLTEEQLKVFFKGAKYQEIAGGGGGASARYTFDELDFQTSDGRYFDIYYYHNVKPSQITAGLKDTTLPYGISIKDSGYLAAKSAL